MAYIDPSDIERIIDAVSIVDVVEDYVKLSRRGANYIGLCPFHHEKTPSFSVSESKRLYKCFGCGKGGNVVSFVMEAEHVSFPEAVRLLAKRANISLPEREDTPQQREQKAERDRLLELVAWAQSWFNRNLLQHTEGRAIGLTYFKERGLTPDTIRTFGLGYALDAPTALTGDALQAGFSAELLVKAGLSSEREGRRFDRFRGRVMFPIQSSSGRTIGFGGRALHVGERTAKYVNSPESEIYHKSATLYGIAQAKGEIIKKNCSILVEGYLDVLQMHQLGVRNVVASSGTSLTVEQARMLYRFSKQVLVLYDGDKAGIKAALRGLDIFLSEGFAVRIALLPEGQDPDDYAKSHTLEEVEAFLTKAAEDIIEFKIRILLADTEGAPTQRAAAITDIVRSIALIPDKLLRTAYMQRASQLTGMEERALFFELSRQLASVARQERRQQGLRDEPSVAVAVNPALPPPRITPGEALEVFERELLDILLQHGEMQYSDGEHPDFDGERAPISIAEYVQRELANDALKFQTPVLRELYNRYYQMDSEERGDPLRALQLDENQELLAVAFELLTQRHMLSVRWSKLGDESELLSDEVAQWAYKSVHIYKSRVLEQRCEALRGQLAMAKDTAELLALEKELKELLEMRRGYDGVTRRVVP